MATTTTDPRVNERFEEIAEQLRNEPKQLSFNIGLPSNKPDSGSLKISGDLPVVRDLKRRQQVFVTVTDPDGTVLAHGLRMVTSIQFKDTEDTHGNVTTERIHSLG